MDFKNKYLSQYFDEVEPREFYRTIFPEGELQKKGKESYGDFKYNAIAVELISPRPTDEKKHTHRYTITDDLEVIDELVKHDNFIILSPISYVGKNRKSDNARYMYALAIDLDGVDKEQHIIDLFYQMDGNGPSNHLPKPTYVVNSGNGLHIYYVFEKPIPCYKNVMKQFARLKNELTRKIWNGFVTSQSENVQYQSVFQGFRLVGGVTKSGEKTRAFEIGGKVTIEYLNEYVDEKYQLTDFRYKADMTLAQAKEKYPDWYEKIIVKKERRGTWKNNRALYEWWKEKLRTKIIEGHRFYGVMCLAIYAKKCAYDEVKNPNGVTYEELENDAFSFIEMLDGKTSSDDNHFTSEDVLSALEMYNDNYVTFPIKTISKLTNVHIQKNKRNHRKQSIHLKLARNQLAMLKELGEIKQGRPNKKNIVEDYFKLNPNAKKVDVIRATGLDKKTVYKYYDEVKKYINPSTKSK